VCGIPVIFLQPWKSKASYVHSLLHETFVLTLGLLLLLLLLLLLWSFLLLVISSSSSLLDITTLSVCRLSSAEW
jgi:predicted ABC-type sugar transport system permease subunit